MSEFQAVSDFDYNVQFFDCDYLGRMKMSAILRICAEVAGYDYTKKGLSHEFLLEKRMAFLTSRVSVHINSYPVSKQTLNVSTWECGKKGAIFLRGIYFKDKITGNILVEALSGWILVDPETRQIYRPGQFMFEMPQVMDRALKALPITKINAADPTYKGSWTAKNTDIDENGHVYNAVYADIASDILNADEFGRRVTDMRINYVSEVRNGETIDLYRADRDDSMIVVGKTGDKISFEFELIDNEQYITDIIPKVNNVPVVKE